MSELPLVFAFDEKILGQCDQDTTFEMAKAAHFFKKHAEKSCEPNVEQTVFYWQYGENTFPEMQLSIHKAKHDYGHLWPQDYSDGSVANLVFQIVSLQRELEKLRRDYETLRGENERIVSELGAGIAVPMEEQSGSYNPVPGIHTILSCAEGRIQLDKGPAPTITMNMQEMEKIRDMFRGGDSTTVTTTLALNATAATALTTAIRDPATLTHRPPLQVHRDGDDREPHDDQPLAPPSPSSSHAIEEVGVDDDDGDVSMESRASSPTSPPFMLPAQPPPHSHKGLQIHKGEPEPSREVATREKPRGLTIYRDPQPTEMQGVSVKGSAVDPSRGFFARPAPPHPPQSSAHPRFSTNENEPALDVHGQLCRSEPTTAFTLPLVFDPACASTAVFVRRQDPSKDEPLAAAALGQTDPTEPLLFDPACASTSVFSQKQGSFKPAANASQPLPLGSLRSVHLTRQGMPFQTIAENSQESSLGRSPKQSLLEFDPTCASTSVFSQKQGSLRPALIADHPLAFGDSKAAHPQHQQQQYPGVSFHPIAEELQELSPGRHVLEFDPTCASTAVFPWRRRTPPIQDPQPPEFAPPCASTAIFARREPPKTSSASLLQGRLPVATETGPTQPPRVIRTEGEVVGIEEVDVMGEEDGCGGGDGRRPTSTHHTEADATADRTSTDFDDQPIADAFARFVRSPDQSGKLRVDVTEFINVFLAKKKKGEH